MPIQRFRIPLDNVGRFPLVESSNRINTVSVTKLSALAEFAFDLGNSQLTSPIDRRCRLRIAPGVQAIDKDEGLALVNETAQAGLSVWLTVSYQRGSEPPNEGVSIEVAG